MDWDKLASKVSTKADLGTVLIFGAAGFVVDAFSTLHGVISPGYFAGLSASTGLGLKSWIDAGMAKRKESASALLEKENVAAAAQSKNESALQKAKLLLGEIKQSGQWGEEATRLEKNIALFEKGGIISVDKLEAATAECIESYLKS